MSSRIDCSTCLYRPSHPYNYCSGCNKDYSSHELIECIEEYPADRIASLRARIAALEKCIEARKQYIDMAGQYWRGSGPVARKLRDAIRRADEEAGRLEKGRGGATE